MSDRIVRDIDTIEEYFFKQNFPIIVGGAIIVLSTNLLWILVALKQGDPYHRLSSSAGYFMYLMVGMSILTVVIHLWGRPRINENNGKYIRWYMLLYYSMLIMSVASIAIANADLIMKTTKVAPGMTIALSAVLLFIIAVAPLSSKLCGGVIIVFLLIGAIVPRLTASGEYYAFVPELLLRLGIIPAYIVVRNRMIDTFEKRNKIRQAADELRAKDSRILGMSEEAVDLLASAVEMRDAESGAHVKRVKKYTKALAECVMSKYPEYGLNQNELDIIVRASALHDLGKIMVPDSILCKPGKLTDEEFEKVKRHTFFGYEILTSATNSWDRDFLDACADIALYHHEKYDGKGYPYGLAGEDIPLSAQIVSIADCYDALVSERHYKSAYSTQEAYDMIMRGECGAFSDKIIDCFTQCKSQFEEIATL